MIRELIIWTFSLLDRVLEKDCLVATNVHRTWILPVFTKLWHKSTVKSKWRINFFSRGPGGPRTSDTRLLDSQELGIPVEESGEGKRGPKWVYEWTSEEEHDVLTLWRWWFYTRSHHFTNYNRFFIVNQISNHNKTIFPFKMDASQWFYFRLSRLAVPCLAPKRPNSNFQFDLSLNSERRFVGLCQRTFCQRKTKSSWPTSISRN